jgi:hypothetical protein
MCCSTAWQARRSRRSSLVARPAHGLTDARRRQLWDHASAFCRRQARAVSENSRVDHQQLGCRAGLAPQHDPAESHLCIHLQDGLGQLHLADLMVERIPKRGHLRGLFVCGQGGQVQLIIDAQGAGAGRGCDRLHARAHALEQWCEEVAGIGWQRKPGVVARRLHAPALGGQEQAVSTAEAQRMLDPNRAVPNRPAHANKVAISSAQNALSRSSLVSSARQTLPRPSTRVSSGSLRRPAA